MALTRRSLLSMLSAGIASVAVSTRLAASELKVVGETEELPVINEYSIEGNYLHVTVRFAEPSARSAPARG